jgi:hypothetical protein
VSRIGERRKHAQAEPSAAYAHKRAAIVEAAARVFQTLRRLVREPGQAQ